MPPSADGSIAPAVDRAFVRNLAVKNFEALQAAAIAGKNTHQLALDQSDEIETLIKTLQPDDRPKFSALYEQELNAATQASVEKTMAMTSQTANQLLDNVTKPITSIDGSALLPFHCPDRLHKDDEELNRSATACIRTRISASCIARTPACPAKPSPWPCRYTSKRRTHPDRPG